MYRTRLNRPRSVYSLNQLIGTDFELSSCKNANKTSINLNQTFKMCFLVLIGANASKNNI